MVKVLKLSPEKQRLAKMLKALGNPQRFQIVEFLAQNHTCITNDIVRNTPLAQSTVSQHLKVLREAGLIRGEIEGPATCYCLDPEGFSLAQGTDRQLADRIRDGVRAGDQVGK